MAPRRSLPSSDLSQLRPSESPDGQSLPTEPDVNPWLQPPRTIQWRWVGFCLATSGLILICLQLNLKIMGLIVVCTGAAFSLWRITPSLWVAFWRSTWARHMESALAWLTLTLSLIGLFVLLETPGQIQRWLQQANWDAIGALGEVFGAAGQILIATLAAYIAWRQYVISKQLTTQQNTITQQQTIDAYFQGISELVLDPDGMLDDWPLERAIAEGRTSAILTGLDPMGKAKILRFLSTANLLTPLRRDDHLGRPILDGMGGYQKDRVNGIRVVNLRAILENADLQGTDLHGIDLSDVSLERANFSRADLSYAYLCRADLRGVSFRGADLYQTKLCDGSPDTATPMQPRQKPDLTTGQHSGALIEDADFSNVQNLSPAQRWYICAWGGARTRGTVPGGCEGIPDQLA